jgi:hypothetical protein
VPILNIYIYDLENKFKKIKPLSKLFCHYHYIVIMSLYHLTDESDAIQNSLHLNMPNLKLKAETVLDENQHETAKGCAILLTGNHSIPPTAIAYSGIERCPDNEGICVVVSDDVNQNTKNHYSFTPSVPRFKVNNDVWLNGQVDAGVCTGSVVTTVGLAGSNFPNPPVLLYALYMRSGGYLSIWGRFDYCDICNGGTSCLFHWRCDQTHRLATTANDATGVIMCDGPTAVSARPLGHVGSTIGSAGALFQWYAATQMGGGLSFSIVLKDTLY